MALCSRCGLYTIKEQLTTKRNVNTPKNVTKSSEQTDADCLIRMEQLLCNVLCKENNPVSLERARLLLRFINLRQKSMKTWVINWGNPSKLLIEYLKSQS